MNKVPDRAKMRREYLRKKATANILRVIGVIITLAFGYILLLCLIPFSLAAIAAIGTGSVLHWRQMDSLLAGYAVTYLIFFGLPTWLGVWFWRSSSKQIRSLVYVPPVCEQLPTLPAEEVLLRGSEASQDSCMELLRPVGSEETKAEELLRAWEENCHSRQ